MKNTFIEKISSLYNPDDLKIVMAGLKTDKRPVSFRVNKLKATPEEVETALEENNI